MRQFTPTIKALVSCFLTSNWNGLSKTYIIKVLEKYCTLNVTVKELKILNPDSLDSNTFLRLSRFHFTKLEKVHVTHNPIKFVGCRNFFLKYEAALPLLFCWSFLFLYCYVEVSYCIISLKLSWVINPFRCGLQHETSI